MTPMQINLTVDDDRTVIEALLAAARHMRKRREPRAAITAGKIEMMLADGLTAISQTCDGEAA